jgi:PAS domain S-box-containing protein
MPQDQKVYLPPGGTMGELIRSKDWSKTPLGPMEQWPQTLLTNLATILETPFPHLICWGRELTMLYNDAYMNVLGKKHPALGNCLIDVWPDAREVIEPLIEKAFAGEPMFVENGQLMITRHGHQELSWADFSFSPLHDTRGAVVGLLTTVIEMTKREKELRESEENFRSVFEGTVESIYVHDFQGRILDANRNTHDMLGYSKGELLKLTPMDIDTVPEKIPERLATLKKEGVLNFETIIVCKDGSRFPVEINAKTITFRGKPSILGVIRDITERKQAEEMLRKSEAKYRMLFENAKLGLFRTDSEIGKIIEVNQRCAEMYGFSRPEEMAGREAVQFFADQDEKAEILSQMSLQKHISNSVSRVRRVDGSEFYVEATAWPGSERGTIEGIHVDITKQIRSQEALRESKELFQSLVETTSDWIWEVDENSRYVYASPKIRDLLGYAPEEVIGKSPFEFMPPDEAERVKGAFEKIRNLCVPFTNLQNRNVRKDGSEIFLESSGVPVPKAGGTLCGYRGVDRDVTERRRMEDELWESRERLHLAKTAAYIGIYDFNISTGTIQWDQLVRNLWGIGPEEPVTYETFIVGVHPDDRAATQAAVDRALKPTGDGRFHSAYRVVSRADGATHWVEATGQVSFEQGHPVRFIGTLQDISDRVRTEQALRESEEKFRAVFEGAVESIYVHDLQGRFLDANKKGYERLGYTKEELMRMSPQDIDDNKNKVNELIQRILKEGSLTFETVHMRKDGSRFPVEINSQVIQYGGGRAILGVVRDITERKVNEKALRDLANELEDKVNERTSELVQANRAKDEFLANMSHEIRTPLAGVFGITEVLLQHDRSDPVREDLEMIRSSAASVLALINDLLDLSRIERGEIEFINKSCNIRYLIDKLVQQYAMQAREKHIAFEHSVNPEVPEQVLCDPDRLGQVLKNLLFNAIKFTARGSVRLYVQAEEQLGQSDQLTRLSFTVSDTGIGMPKAKINQIFQRFTQLDHSYSKRFAGAGLGLAISKQLVELMGGEISVESEEGKGSTFVFSLELEKVNPIPKEQLPEITLADLPPRTVLLAEDNSVNRLFLKRALTSAGHIVDEAENGIVALEKLQGKRFDFVLMDIQMPEMDGIEATRRIRSGKHGRPDIPIIALTAYAMKGDREKFLEGGMDGYVTKPVDFGELSRVIAEVCENEE